MTTKTRARIFWWHPQLTEYRSKFFGILISKFEIRFFFQEQSDIQQQLNCVYAKNAGRINIHGLGLSCLTLQDLGVLFNSIRWANVFVSSFVWNSYTLVGLILCRLLKRKVIVWEEINAIFPELKFRIRDTILQVLLKHIDAIFVLGGIQKDILTRFGVAPEKVFVANEYPGYIYSRLRPRKIALPFNRNVKIVLYMGRLVAFKGVEYLIRAFRIVEAQHENAALVITGYGPLREDLENLSRTLRIKNIHFAGDIADPHVRAYLLRRSSMVVAPSITTKNGMHEGGPLVVLEALSAGKPVIGTNALGSSTSLIQNGLNGYIVVQKDVNGLADKISYLLDTDSIASAQVLSTFHSIKGHEYQAEQFQEAVRYALKRVGRAPP